MEQEGLERIAELLESCLRRIDGDAAIINDGREAADPEATMAALHGHTEQLRSLLHTLLGHLEGPLDLNVAVQEAVDALLRQLEVPLVVNTLLQEGLPRVAWPREALNSSLRRALHLAASHAGLGGEISVGTRLEGGLVLFELTASGQGDRRVQERGSTLQDFVDQMEGRCLLQVDDQDKLHLLIEFKSGARVEDV